MGCVYQYLQLPSARAVFAAGGTTAPGFPFSPLNGSFFPLERHLMKKAGRGFESHRGRGRMEPMTGDGQGGWQGSCFLRSQHGGMF